MAAKRRASSTRHKIQGESVVRYIHRLRDALNLSQCEIRVARQHSEEGTGAEVDKTYGRSLYTIWLAFDFAELPPADQRHFVVHELTHILFFPLEQVVCNTAGALGVTGYDLTSKAHRDAVEEAVDHIAAVLAPSLPLPEGRLVVDVEVSSAT